MGFIGLLKFTLLCIDFLAWPVLGLVYPLFASVRAIERDSKYHLRKLAIYWTLFSLISLFEFAFLKIIVWIPFWSSIKLVLTFWLVMPEFDGANIAYQSFVRPWLLVNLQEVTNRFYKPNKEKLHNMETFLDIADKYIKENGYEALEKLILIKRDCQVPENSQRDIRLLESGEKVVAATSEELKEPDAAQTRNDVIEAMGKSASTKAKQVQNGKPIPVVWVQKGIDAASHGEIKKTPPEKKIEPEWNCVLCEVKTTSERTLNDHLQGRKHKSMLESLKTSFKSNQEAVKSKSGEGSQQKYCRKAEQNVAAATATQEFKLWCNVCKVKLLSEIDMVSHVKGKRHSTNMETMLKLAAGIS